MCDSTREARAEASLAKGIAASPVMPVVDREAPEVTINSTNRMTIDGADQEPVLSRKRWHILIAVCIIGLGSALQSTGPLLNQLLKLLDLKVDTYLYIDLIFNYLTALLAMPAVVLVDKFGLRLALHVAASVFCMSSLTTSMLYFALQLGWQRYMLPLYISTSILKTGFMSIFLLLPLKISESWFPASERSLAWMIMFHPLTIGSCIACLIYPRIILEPADFRILAYVGLVAAAVSMIACVVLVTKSEPATPPSKRAASQDQAPLFVSLKRIFKRRDILLHQLHGCISISVSMTFGTVLQDILASIGLSQVFTGNYMLINNLLSIVLSIIMSSFLHKVESPVRACKLGSLVQTGAFIIKLLAVMNSAPGWLMIVVSVLITIAGSWSMPHNTEMTAALVSGAVSKPTIMGFSLVVTPIAIGLIQSIFAKLILKLADTNSYYNALIFLIGISMINELIYQALFWGKQTDSN